MRFPHDMKTSTTSIEPRRFHQFLTFTGWERAGEVTDGLVPYRRQRSPRRWQRLAIPEHWDPVRPGPFIERRLEEAVRELRDFDRKDPTELRVKPADLVRVEIALPRFLKLRRDHNELTEPLDVLLTRLVDAAARSALRGSTGLDDLAAPGFDDYEGLRAKTVEYHPIAVRRIFPLIPEDPRRQVPTNRGITLSLMDAVGEIRRRFDHRWGPPEDPEDLARTLTTDAVDSTLPAALGDLPIPDDGELIIRCAWEPELATPRFCAGKYEMPSEVRFTPEELEFIGESAPFVGADLDEESGKLARVVGLNGKPGNSGRVEGKVRFEVKSGPEWVLADTTLDADDYAIAARAHLDATLLRVWGRLFDQLHPGIFECARLRHC